MEKNNMPDEIKLIEGVVEYLNGNHNLNSIGATSIGHRELDQALAIMKGKDLANKDSGSEWLPIESAPKDGTEVLALDEKTKTMHVSHNVGLGWHDPDNHYYSEADDFRPNKFKYITTPTTTTVDNRVDREECKLDRYVGCGHADALIEEEIDHIFDNYNVTKKGV